MGLYLLISKEEIAEKIEQTANKLCADYRGSDLVIVMVLKGALCIAADLIRKIDLPLEIEFVQCSSYGSGGTQRGDLTVLGLERLSLHNRDVLIVDDIFDSGRTLHELIEQIGKMKPRSLKSCVLLVKETHSLTHHRPDYALFQIENRFVVGYGLDYKEQYRSLPGIYYFSEEP